MRINPPGRFDEKTLVLKTDVGMTSAKTRERIEKE
jgi:hypothetical protein